MSRLSFLVGRRSGIDSRDSDMDCTAEIRCHDMRYAIETLWHTSSGQPTEPILVAKALGSPLALHKPQHHGTPALTTLRYPGPTPHQLFVLFYFYPQLCCGTRHLRAGDDSRRTSTEGRKLGKCSADGLHVCFPSESVIYSLRFIIRSVLPQSSTAS